MRPVIAIIFTALVFTGLTWFEALGGADGPIVSAFFTVLACLALACFVGGAMTPAALVLGALGALAQVVLWPLSPILAGGVLFVCLYGARALRARGGWRWSVFHVLLALVGGALGTWIIATWNVSAELWNQMVSVGVASLLASASWVLRADDVVALSLEAVSQRNSGATKWRLERAAALRRKLGEQAGIPRAESLRLRKVFKNLLRLGESRIRVGDVGAESIDETIAEHLAALEERLNALSAREAAVERTRRGDVHDLRQDNLGVEAEVEALSIGNEPRGA